MKRQALYAVWLIAFLAGCSFPINVKVTILPTPTLDATATLTPTPTVTPSPTPTPTPTPPPAVRIWNAEQSLFLGDYEQARKAFQESAAAATDPELRAAAMLGMGKALYLEKNYPEAAKTLKEMLSAYPNDLQASTAYFYLARTDDAQQHPQNALDAYAKYLQLKPGVLDDYIQELVGDDFFASGQFESAIQAYQAAIKASPDAASSIWIILKLGDAYSSSGDYTTAIDQYQSAFEKSDSDYVKAHANLLIGKAYLALGRPQQAYTHFLDSVNNYPAYYDAYTGLVELVNAGVPVDDFQRGLVDYHAGKYGLAVDAFTRIVTQSDSPSPAVFFYRAMAYQDMNEPGNAIADLDYILTNYDSGSYPAKAADEKATILWTTFNNLPDAAQTFLDFVQKYPASPDAADFLFQAARMLERNDQLDLAADAWERMINEYPASTESYRGLFLAGVARFRARAYDKALVIFQRCLVLTTDPEEQAAANLWIGKTQQAQGNSAAAKSAWTVGAEMDPTGYYSIRANDLLNGDAPFKITQPVDYGYDLNQERGEAEAWLKATFNLPADTNLSGPGRLANDARYRRGEAFWELGLYNDARNEFEIVRKAVLDDPENTYRLMNRLYELGIYRSAILASRQILDLAGLDDAGTLKAPAYFNHIRFGIYFKDLVFDAGQSDAFNPLFVLSVMRQESLFEGFAISSAGARGLMQIMPATGGEIASIMGWPDNYTSDDLYRPVISIPMGTRYLARQRDYFDGSLYAALSAYNGGPGNTSAWENMAGKDPDLLLEVIRSDETRTYIQRIYEYFNMYRILYSRSAP